MANKNKNPYTLGILAICIAAALWGIDQVVIRPNLFHIENVATIVFIEHLIGFIIMSFFCIQGIKEIKKLKLSDWATFLWISVFGGAIGTMAIVKALMIVQFNPVSIVALLQKLQPIFAIVVAMILLKEMPKKSFYIWALVALIGSYFVTFGFSRPDISLSNNVFVAALYALLAAFAFGSSTSFGKHALKKVSFKTAAYIRFGMTTIITFIIILLTGSLTYFSRITSKDMLFFIIIALTSGSVAMFIYYYGLKKVPATIATFCELAYPITAILLDYIINGKVLSMGQWFGAILIVGSVIIITRSKVEVKEDKKIAAKKANNKRKKR
ncbi:MAG: DMT family transporter [Nanoarchaeota archaeon]|nr:DMT family transporter [Nanoarchaeota archaeon]